MRYLLWIVPLGSLAAAQESVELLEQDVELAAKAFANEAQEDCNNLPFKSHFVLDTMACFVAQDSSRDCGTIRYLYANPTSSRTEKENKILASVGIKEDNSTHICVFRLGQLEIDDVADAVNETLSVSTTDVTTTKTITTSAESRTTQSGKIENPKKWIVNRGAKIYRRVQDALLQHTYTLESTDISVGWRPETGPGFVVSEDDYDSIKETCPDLIRVGVWRDDYMVTHIGNKPTADMHNIGAFYCSPKQFYCGANFQLRGLDKEGGYSRLYPSSDEEALRQLIGDAPGVYRNFQYANWPCWVWQNYTETWYSIVKAGGNMIHRGYNEDSMTHFYSLSLYKIPYGDGSNWEVGPGFVVTEPLYQLYFKEQCPELIKMSIWHGSNEKGEKVSYIGKNAPNGFNFQEKSYQQFYCAPRWNYCNANFELKRIDKEDGSAFFYPSSASEASKQLGDSPPQPAFVKYIETPCYIWRNWLP